MIGCDGIAVNTKVKKKNNPNIKEAAPYRCGARKCSLCFAEKLQIIKAKPEGLLNKRSELISKCRHKNKFLLKNVD